MKIIIKSKETDLESKAISYALSKRGHDVMNDIALPFPYGTTDTIKISPKVDTEDSIDVVIDLSIHQPLVNPNLSDVDKDYASKEANLFLKAQDFLYAPHAFWVNPPSSNHTSSLKPVQLHIAKSHKLKIPDTIITNDPKSILALLECHNNNVVMKPSIPITWTNDQGEGYSCITTKITKDMVLESESAIIAAPAIYQNFIEKQFEIRVTIMGNTIIAAKLNSQENEDTSVDWRNYSSKATLSFSTFTLPEEIQLKCIAVMKSFGLVYGAIDLIYDKEGNYIFLEVNNLGHFLWKELKGQSFPMIHIFCDFIESCDENFVWNGNEEYIYQDWFEHHYLPEIKAIEEYKWR